MSTYEDPIVIWSDDPEAATDAIVSILHEDWEPIRHAENGVVGFGSPDGMNDVLSVYNLIHRVLPTLRIDGEAADPLAHYDDLVDFVETLHQVIQSGQDEGPTEIPDEWQDLDLPHQWVNVIIEPKDYWEEWHCLAPVGASAAWLETHISQLDRSLEESGYDEFVVAEIIE